MNIPGLGDEAVLDYTWEVLIRMLFVYCIGLTLVTLLFNASREWCGAMEKKVVKVRQTNQQCMLLGRWQFGEMAIWGDGSIPRQTVRSAVC